MVEAYCKQFFGYGRWDAPVWFIGLEEAGTGKPAELQIRLAAWDKGGRRELEDAPEFYPKCGQHQWHGQDATLQCTWRQLMRIVRLARGETVEESGLLEYQQRAFGASTGDLCITELSPLPARNQGHWPYAAYTDVPAWMKTREQFMQAIAKGRIATLREKIATHHPRAVVFFISNRRDSSMAKEDMAQRMHEPKIPGEVLGLDKLTAENHHPYPPPGFLAGQKWNTRETTRS